jgi:hypothetical protein
MKTIRAQKRKRRRPLSRSPPHALTTSHSESPAERGDRQNPQFRAYPPFPPRVKCHWDFRLCGRRFPVRKRSSSSGGSASTTGLPGRGSQTVACGEPPWFPSTATVVTCDRASEAGSELATDTTPFERRSLAGRDLVLWRHYGLPRLNSAR